VVIGEAMMGDAKVGRMLGHKPVLLLREASGQPLPPGAVFSFGGEEDLSQLAEVLLER
jgi:hypothetical protein